jgi:hypothetical protein
MPNYAFYDPSQDRWSGGKYGYGFLWVCPRHCCIDLKDVPCTDKYYRYVPPSAAGFGACVPAVANPGTTDSDAKSEFKDIDTGFVTVALPYFHYAAAKAACGMNGDSWNDKGSHKNTRTILGKVNRNEFSRVARIVEIGYRYYFAKNPGDKPVSPYVRWTDKDLVRYAEACAKIVTDNVDKCVDLYLAERFPNPSAPPVE